MPLPCIWQTRQCHEGEAWNCRLSAKALRFGALLSEYMDSVDAKVAQFFADLLEANAVDASLNPPPNAGGGTRTRVRDSLMQILRVSPAHFCTQPVALRTAVLAILKRLLAVPGRWLESSVLLKDREIKATCAALPDAQKGLPALCLAMRVAHLCHFGAADLATTNHGTPIIWFVKRPLVATDPSYASYVNFLSALNFRVSDYQATAHDADGVEQPPTAPILTLPSPPTAAQADAAVALLNSLLQAA